MLVLLPSKEQHHPLSSWCNAWARDGTEEPWVRKEGLRCLCAGLAVPHVRGSLEESCALHRQDNTGSFVQVGYARESQPLAQVLGVEYIPWVQQNYMITQQNIPEIIKSFRNEVGTLKTVIKVLLLCLFSMLQWNVTAGSYTTIAQELLSLSFLESFKLTSCKV